MLGYTRLAFLIVSLGMIGVGIYLLVDPPNMAIGERGSKMSKRLEPTIGGSVLLISGVLGLFITIFGRVK
jgi:hypothetical protein